jgi:hypothetical protein
MCDKYMILSGMLQSFSAAGFGYTVFSSDTKEVYMVDDYGRKWFCMLELVQCQNDYFKLGAEW